MTPFDEGASEMQDLPAQEEEISPELQDVAEILSKYWCSPSQKEEEYFAKVLEKEHEYFEFLLELGFLQMYRVAYSAYYGMNGSSTQFESQSIRFSGDDDERVEYCVNEFRSFCDQIINMTTKNRPAFQAQAINTDSSSLAQIEASDNTIKYYYEQEFGERREKEVVACEIRYGKSFTYMDWDKAAGAMVEIEEPVADNTFNLPPVKKNVKAGKLIIKRKYPWHVISDPYKSEHDEHSFRIVHEYTNKYELIAKYPLYAKVINEQTGKGECTYTNMFPGPTPRMDGNSDDVLTRIVLHDVCAVLPEGRRSLFVGEKLVDDGPLPIEQIPVLDFMSCELDSTGAGISDMWNLIPEQQMNNQILSDIATNVEAFGRPPLAVVEGSDLDIDALANGQKVMTIASMDQMPQTVQFPQVNEVSIKLVEMNRKLMQALSGLNGIARGESDASVKSGTHAALYHAMAVENQSPRQSNLDLHRERSANMILLFLKKFATYPQMVAIAGEDERPYMKSLTQKDVAGVHRVIVKTKSAMMMTQAGRITMAELLRDWPGQPLKDPTQIVELVTSGQLKPMYNGTRTDQLRARRENELLAAAPPVQEVPGQIDPMTGMPGAPTKTVPTVPVLATDNAAKHIAMHLEILVAPDTIDNPAKMDAVLTHIMEHVELARTGDPFLAALLGLPMPQDMMQPPGMDPGADGSGPSDQDVKAASKVSTPPDEQDDSASAMGNLPKPAKPPRGAMLA